MKLPNLGDKKKEFLFKQENSHAWYSEIFRTFQTGNFQYDQAKSFAIIL